MIRLVMGLGTLLAMGCGSGVNVGFDEAPLDGAAGAAGAGGSSSKSKVFVHVRSTHAAVAHTDALSGQTPTDAVLGIRRLDLFETSSAPAGDLIFDHGAKAVEAKLGDGDDTVVAVVAAAGLTAKSYARARVVVSHTRFTVNTSMHAMGQVVPGTLTATIAMSAGTSLEGSVREAGWYKYVFSAQGQQFPLEGTGLDFPALSSGGFEVKKEGSETAYYFPVDLQVDPSTAADVHVVLEVNMHESFRWQDQPDAGYQPKVFDSTPSSFEPVKQLGANSFALTLK